MKSRGIRSFLAVVLWCCASAFIVAPAIAQIPVRGVTATGKLTPCPFGYTGYEPNCTMVDPAETPADPTTSKTDPLSGGGGAGREVDQPDAPARSCGDAVDPLVRAMGDQLKPFWESGDSDETALGDRHEMIGWMVRTADGGTQIRQWIGPDGQPLRSPDFRGWCNNIPLDVAAANMPPEGAGAIIGFIHTHPYSFDTDLVNCDWQPDDYNGLPSDYDRESSRTLGQFLGRSGALMGYMIDRDHIVAFWGDLLGTIQSPRCY